MKSVVDYPFSTFFYHILLAKDQYKIQFLFLSILNVSLFKMMDSTDLSDSFVNINVFLRGI